ncbi:MAG: glycosyltransferase [Vulcanimicrobiaceae bacterium]
MTAPFLESVAKMQLPSSCSYFDRYVVTGNFIPAQRELIFDEALAKQFDVLVMIDDDIVFPPDALERLIKTLEDDPQTGLVGALYYSRDGLRPMAVDRWNGGDTTTALVPAFDDSTAGIVDGVGFGCVAIRLEALAQLERPFLSAHIIIQRAQRLVRITDEDYLFCERLRRGGWKVRLHAGVRCRHYDRASKMLVPAKWEPLTETTRQRMYVRTEQGEALIEPDDSLPCGHEEHRPVMLDYVSVD